jgi:hypothetical protein
MYVAAAATAIAVLVVGIMLWYQTPSAASVEKTAQYKQSGGLNQNPTQNVQSTPPAPNSDNNKRTNENGFGDDDGN